MLSIILSVYKLKYADIIIVLYIYIYIYIGLNVCSIFVNMELLSIFYLPLYLVGSHDVSS